MVPRPNDSPGPCVLFCDMARPQTSVDGGSIQLMGVTLVPDGMVSVMSASGSHDGAVVSSGIGEK